jgi:hypothetical protein
MTKFEIRSTKSEKTQMTNIQMTKTGAYEVVTWFLSFRNSDLNSSVSNFDIRYRIFERSFHHGSVGPIRVLHQRWRVNEKLRVIWLFDKLHADAYGGGKKNLLLP